MADGVVFRVEGLTRLQRELLALGFEVVDLKAGMAELVRRGVAIAEAHAPVGGAGDPHPGQLRDDIRGSKAAGYAVVMSGRASIPYARPINYGWPDRNIAASGYMQAIDTELGPKVPSLLEQSINELIVSRGLG